MRSKSHEDLRTSSPWQTTPRWSITVFLLAVFFIFAAFGFVFDGMSLGRQPNLRFAFSVVIVGLFAVGYATMGITLRKRFWIGFVPLFVLQHICMALLNIWMPDAPPFAQLDPVQLNRLHNRLIFDGVAVMVAIALGYVGFLVVSVSEARRRIRLELEKASLESELAAAREIQRLMVPEELPPAPDMPLKASIAQPRRLAETSSRSSRSAATRLLSSSETLAARG